MSLTLDRESAAEFGRRVNSVLRDYIDAQNSIFKFSFMRALGLKSVNPAAAAETVKKLREQIDEMLDEVRGLKLDSSDGLGAFFMTMRPYLREIYTAMSFFIDFCERMVSAHAEKHSRYWKVQYKSDLKELQQHEADYLKIGVELNERWKKIREAQK